MKLPHWFSALCVLIIVAAVGLGGFLLGKQSQPPVVTPVAELPTGVQLIASKTVERPSYITEQDIEGFINSSPLVVALRGRGIGAACKAAEAKYGIGADILFAIVRWESGDGTGPFVVHPTYGRLNNYMSIGVYTGSPERYRVWKDSMENIMAGAELLDTKFLNPANWRYKGGLLEDIAYYYCGGDAVEDAKWYNGIYGKMDQFDAWCQAKYKTEWESVLAKRWSVSAKLMRPSSTILNYWGTPLTREQLAVLLYRIQTDK